MDAVVVTFNSERELASLARHRSSLGFDRIVVVDNASNDQTCAVAREAGMVLVRQDHNAGFGQAANVGARRTQGSCFALLNPDIRFEHAEDVDRLTHHFDDERVGVVGPQLVLPNGEKQDCARAVPSPVNLLKRRLTGGQHGMVTARVARDVPWVVGGCMVIRRAAFQSVGGFDPRYFLYFEDVDLCVRLWQRGWRVRFEPSVLVRHEHRAASRGRLWSPATRHHIGSAARFYLRHPRYVGRSSTGPLGPDMPSAHRQNEIEARPR